MKNFAFALLLLVISSSAIGADSAGLAGIVQTNDTVNVDGFVNPRNIWTVYTPNDPSRTAVVLAYVAYKKVGSHQISVVWRDKDNKVIDSCEFTPTQVDSLPYIETITCRYGGRMPTGGLDFSVYNAHNGSREKIGGIYLPARP